MQSNKMKPNIKSAKAEKITKQDLIDALKLWRRCNGNTDWARRMRSDMENEAYDRTVELLMKLRN